MLRGSITLPFSGGGIGLKSAGVLAQSGAQSSVTGTTTETVLGTINIPANAMSANGMLRVSGLFNFTGTAGTHTIGMRLNGVQIMSDALNATSLHCEFLRTIRAANSQTAQVSQSANAAGPGSSTSNALSTAVNMAQAQTLTITATLAAAADTAALLGYTVEVLNP